MKITARLSSGLFVFFGYGQKFLKNYLIFSEKVI